MFLFLATIAQQATWQQGLSTRHAPPAAIPDAGYDWAKSTADNHKHATAPLREEFAESRARLDYNWHVKYSLRRQEKQDAIIRAMLKESAAACFANEAGVGPRPPRQALMTRWRGRHGLSAPTQPWAVFTAGCMGAGKTHVMSLLDEHGLLPLSSFVRIDLDRIRAQLPETKTYMRLNKQTAGLLTQAEAGAIAEIATEEAFKQGLHVWVDSSLKDANWWTQEMKRLRATYPQYKMGIVHVRASWENVVQREARRGQVTGRRIPPTLLADVFEQVPRAVKQLQKIVDLYVEVDNDGPQPRLRRSEDVLSFMRLCRQLQPASKCGARWRKQQAFQMWRWFDAEPAD